MAKILKLYLEVANWFKCSRRARKMQRRTKEKRVRDKQSCVIETKYR